MPRFKVSVHRIGNPPQAPKEYEADHVAHFGEPWPADGVTLLYSETAVAMLVIMPTGEQPAVPAPQAQKRTEKSDAN